MNKPAKPATTPVPDTNDHTATDAPIAAPVPAQPFAVVPDAHHGTGGLYVIGADGQREQVEATEDRT